MINEEIKKYLPQYLSEKSSKNLFKELENFPFNKAYYSENSLYDDEVIQGDGIEGLPYCEIPNDNFKNVKGIILSNSCDIDSNNKRLYPMKVVHAPIVDLIKYQSLLIEKHVYTKLRKEHEVDSHIKNIKNQKISNILYLPKNSKIEESIVFLDRVASIPLDKIDISKISVKKLFTLNNFGFYLFLFKLSIHTTRIREGIDRS